MTLPMELVSPLRESNQDVSDSQWELILQAIHKAASKPLDEKCEELPETELLQDPIPLIPIPNLQLKEKKKTRRYYKNCPVCGKLVSNISVHLRYHNDEYKFPCEFCPKKLRDSFKLTRHQLSTHIEKFNYSCNQCPKLFKELDKLTQHQQTHSKETSDETHLINPLSHAIGKRLKRPHLKVYSESQLALSRDGIKLNIKIKKLMPTQVSKITTIDFQLQNNELHIECFTCLFCEKKFKDDHDLQMHLMDHAIQKPHVCSQCNKAFAERVNLKDHMPHNCSQS